MVPRVIRPPAGVLVGGILFMVAALASCGVRLAMHLTHPPVVWDQVTVLLTFFQPAGLLAFGMIFILAFANVRLTYDDQGITTTGLLGRTNFQSSWAEIDRIERRSNRGKHPGESYVIHAGKQHMLFSTKMPEADQILREIYRRNPNLKL